jgi:hypothetical protein
VTSTRGDGCNWNCWRCNYRYVPGPTDLRRAEGALGTVARNENFGHVERKCLRLFCIMMTADAKLVLRLRCSQTPENKPPDSHSAVFV